MLRAARIHARAGAWRSRWRAGEGGGAGAPGQDSDPRAAARRVSPARGRERLRHPAADPKAVFHAGRVRARCPALELRRWERPARCDIGHGSELWAQVSRSAPAAPRAGRSGRCGARGSLAPSAPEQGPPLHPTEGRRWPQRLGQGQGSLSSPSCRRCQSSWGN